MIQTGLITAVSGVLDSGLKIVDQLVQDKDKVAEYAFETQKLKLQFIEKLVLMNTLPWVDAMVKVMFALLALARPIGSLYLTIIGVDMAQAEIEAGDAISTVSGGLSAAFPAWMGAREVHKRRVEETKRKAIEKNLWVEEYD